MQHPQPSQPIQYQRDGLAIAFELVFTPGIFAVFGHLLDRRLETTPVFAIAFGAVVAVTVVALTIWRYQNDMESAAAELRAARAARPTRPARWERSTGDQPRLEAAQASQAEPGTAYGVIA